MVGDATLPLTGGCGCGAANPEAVRPGIAGDLVALWVELLAERSARGSR